MMLFDLEALDDEACNFHMECMCKALSLPPDDGIWEPHHSPFLQTLIEAFTQQGISRSDAMLQTLNGWIAGEWFVPGEVAFPGAGPYWLAAKLPDVAAYLASKTPATMLYEDWSMLVDYLLQTNFSTAFAVSHAEWLAVRASIMGKLQGTHPDLTLAQADNVLAAMPNTIAQAISIFGGTTLQHSVMTYGSARCAESITGLTDSVRHKMKAIILADVSERMGTGVAGPGSGLQTKLLDSFADMNRDWRRIAVTETGETCNQGFLANVFVGSQVKRLEHYKGACSFCARLNGKVFDVVDPAAEPKDGNAQVWVGKSNVGRSASPRKKFMGSLVTRDESELWWPAGGLQHPHCRGSWVLQPGKLPGMEPDAHWDGWLAALGV
jgi:hypothetical protein